MKVEAKETMRLRTRKESGKVTKRNFECAINNIKDQETDFFMIVTDETTAIGGNPKKVISGLSYLIAALRDTGISMNTINKAVNIGEEIYKDLKDDDEETDEDNDDNEISKEDIEKIKAFCDMLFGDSEDE